ncbi:MAG: carbohydrate kinase family protein, partial [Candidatus Bathyarchaeia archaeon]
MMRFDVIGFGALNVDKLYKVNKIAGPEEEGFIKGFEEACGGSAANTIVGLARLGCKVGFIGKVANDREGKMLLEDFRKEGVDTRGVIRAKEGRSGTVMGFVDEKGERALYVDPGVNDTISFEEIDVKYACRARFLHLTSFVGDKSFEAQKRLVEALPEDVKVSMDPG